MNKGTAGWLTTPPFCLPAGNSVSRNLSVLGIDPAIPAVGIRLARVIGAVDRAARAIAVLAAPVRHAADERTVCLHARQVKISTAGQVQAPLRILGSLPQAGQLREWLPGLEPRAEAGAFASHMVLLPQPGSAPTAGSVRPHTAWRRS